MLKLSKRKHSYALVLATLFFCPSVFGQIMFHKLFDMGVDGSVTYCIRETPGQNYIGTGLLVTYQLSSTGGIVWKKSYAIECDSFMGIPLGHHSITGLFVEPTYDNGYVVTGYSSAPSRPIKDVVIKTNGSGNVQWIKMANHADNYFQYTSRFNHVEELNDHGFIITGSCIDSSFITPFPWEQPLQGMYCLRLDQNGDTLWTSNIFSDTSGLYLGNLPACEGYMGAELSNGDIALVGTYTGIYAGSPVQNILLTRLDANGNHLWTKRYNVDMGGVQPNTRFTPTSDGGFVMISTQQDPTMHYSTYLIKTDVAGNVSWAKYYQYTGGVGHMLGAWVQETDDGGFVFNGSANGGGIFFIVKTNSTGDIQWSKDYEGFNMAGSTCFVSYGYYLEQTSDHGFVSNIGNPYNEIIKTNQWGELGNCHNELSIDETSYIPLVSAGGFTRTSGRPFDAVPFYEWTPPFPDSILCNSSKPTSVVNESEFQFNLYPNPSDGEFYLSTDEALYPVSLKIFNTAGQISYAGEIQNAEEKINTNLASGIYYLQARSGNMVKTFKLVIQ